MKLLLTISTASLIYLNHICIMFIFYFKQFFFSLLEQLWMQTPNYGTHR